MQVLNCQKNFLKFFSYMLLQIRYLEVLRKINKQLTKYKACIRFETLATDFLLLQTSYLITPF